MCFRKTLKSTRTVVNSDLLWSSVFIYEVWHLPVLFKACRGVYLLHPMPIFIYHSPAQQVTGPCCCLLFLSSRRLSQDGLFIASAWAEFISEVRSNIYTVSGIRFVWEKSYTPRRKSGPRNSLKELHGGDLQTRRVKLPFCLNDRLKTLNRVQWGSTSKLRIEVVSFKISSDSPTSINLDKEWQWGIFALQVNSREQTRLTAILTHLL